MLKILSLNTHKGFSLFNQRLVLPELRQAIRDVQADIVLLQEVVGEHQLHASNFEGWPNRPQYEFLADEIWPQYAYGKNAVYPLGHHGNAILSKLPILESERVDVSASKLEQRGFLYAKLHQPGENLPLHILCVHLGLVDRWRSLQLERISDFVSARIPPLEPVVIGGDFNDWNTVTDSIFCPQGFREVFTELTGSHAKTYPAIFPVLKLDRIYIRGLRSMKTEVHRDRVWRRLSDHLAISAEIDMFETATTTKPAEG